MTASDPNPAGALLCVDAATGRRLWECPAADTVLTRPAVDAVNVYFGSRDGFLYAADRADGRVRWKHDLGAPVVAAPAVALVNGHSRAVYAASTAGRVCALDPATGRVLWTFDVRQHAGALKAELLSGLVVRTEPGTPERRLILVGATVTDSAGATARLYGLEETQGGGE
jgi:outer membrane protein assembly factor BamB